MKIGILFGSKSVESEISILSANQIYHKLKNNYDVELIYIDKELNFYTGKSLKNIDNYKDLDKLKKSLKKINIKKGGYINKTKIDIFIPLIHGTYGEDGNIYGYLNMLDAKYIGGSIQSMVQTQDKSISKKVLDYHNIPQIDCVILNEFDFYNDEEKSLNILNDFGYPLLIKPSLQGSSIGIKKIDKINAYGELKKAFNYSKTLVIEKYINDFKEVNQSVLYDGKLKLSKLEEVKKSSDILSFSDKYTNNQKLESYDKFNLSINQAIENKIKLLSEKVYNIFNLNGIVRIDYMIFDDEVYVNEINSVPGSLAHYLWEDDFNLIIDKLIKVALLKDNIDYNNNINIFKMDGIKK